MIFLGGLFGGFAADNLGFRVSRDSGSQTQTGSTFIDS